MFTFNKRMPPKAKKRQAKEVEQWTAVSAIAASLAKISRQKHQFHALLKQVADVTAHDYLEPEKPWCAKDFEFTDQSDIQGYVMGWLNTFLEELQKQRQGRDQALKALRGVDVLDDDALKSSAQYLTQSESTLDKLEHTLQKWAKIVRYESNSKDSLHNHTERWLTRWLRQWQKTTNIFRERIKQFQEALPRFQNDE